MKTCEKCGAAVCPTCGKAKDAPAPVYIPVPFYVYPPYWVQPPNWLPSVPQPFWPGISTTGTITFGDKPISYGGPEVQLTCGPLSLRS